MFRLAPENLGINFKDSQWNNLPQICKKNPSQNIKINHTLHLSTAEPLTYEIWLWINFAVEYNQLVINIIKKKM